MNSAGCKVSKVNFFGARKLPFHGLKIQVLPLERICKSKEFAARDKDKLHILAHTAGSEIENSGEAPGAVKPKNPCPSVPIRG